MIAHFEHFPTAAADGFHDDADEIFGDVDNQALDGLELLAVFVAHHDFGLADHDFKAFAAHGFDQDGELQFAAAEHAEGFGRFGIFHADGNVGEKLLCQAIAKVARSEIGAFAAAEGAGIDAKDHGQGRLVDGQRLKGRGIFEGGDALADLNAFHAGDGHDVARDNGFGFIAFEPAEGVKLRDFGGNERAVQLADAHFFAAIERAVEDAADRQAPQKFGVIEIGDLELEDAGGIAGGTGDAVDDGLEER